MTSHAHKLKKTICSFQSKNYKNILFVDMFHLINSLETVVLLCHKAEQAN